MPALPTVPITTISDTLAQLAEQVQLKRAEHDRAWSAFEAARRPLHDPRATFTDAQLDAADKAKGVADDLGKELLALENRRDALYRVTATGEKGPRNYARRGRGEAPEPGEWLHGEITRMSEHYAIASGAGIGAAVTPVDQPDAYFDLLSPRSVALASGFSVLPTERGEVHVPRVTEDTLANWTAEGAAITEDEPTGDTVIARPKKLAGLTMINNEVLADSTPQALAVAEASLLRSMSLRLDLGLLAGSGVAPQPLGVAGVSGIQIQSMGTNGAPITSLDPLIDAIAALESEDAEASAITMSPRTWKALLKLRESTDSLKPLISPGNGTDAPRRSVLGVPVFVTSQLPVNEVQGTAVNASSVLVYEARQIVAVRRQDAEIVVAPLAGFNTDQTGVRVISRWDVVVPNPLAVVLIEGVIPA